MIRQPKTITKCCPTCRRDGWEEKEYFSLMTEEEQIRCFGGLAERSKIPHPEGAEVCYARVGATIHSAIAEGIKLANDLNKTVCFEFNGELVVLDKYSDHESKLRDWWQRAYDETPEQSFERR